MMTNTSADLWFRPPSSYSVAAEDAGAFGTVCEPVGGVAKKKVTGGPPFFSTSTNPLVHLRDWAHMPDTTI